MASSKSKVKSSRSPAPLRTPTTPSQFFPPSYFAAAAGVSYPLNQQVQFHREPETFSSNAAHLVTEHPHTSILSRVRRRSQLGDLEPQLLPTLSDTIERMTRPPSQVVSTSPFRAVPEPGYSPGAAHTPSTSLQSHGSSTYSAGSEACGSGSVTAQVAVQPAFRSPSNAHSEQPPSGLRLPSSRSPNPKSILKSHALSDRHLQVPQSYSENTRLASDHAQKTGRNPVPIPPEPILLESTTEHTRQMPTSPRLKIDGSNRTNRVRSRTDPGTSPKGRSNQQSSPQPSGIPRRVPPGPTTPRIPTAAHGSVSGLDTGNVNSTQPEKRRLFVTNAEISSSSSESQPPWTRYIKPKPLSRTDSQSSTETQLRPPRFGLGLGLSGINESRNSIKFSSAQRWTAKTTGDESYLRYTNFPSHKSRQCNSIPKRRGRSPVKHTPVDCADSQRRHRELLSLMHDDPDDSSGCDSRPSSIEVPGDQCLSSNGSGDPLRSPPDDSGSEYSPAEEDDHAVQRNSIWRETKVKRTRSKVSVQHFRNGLPGENSPREYEQYTPRASSTSPSGRRNKGQIRGYSAAMVHDEEPFGTESSTAVSDEDVNSPNETATQINQQRYSSELSRIMAVSMAAAARQRQAFGIGSSPDLQGQEAASAELPHADSDMSLIGGDRWQYDCDELATGSLLQQLDRTRGTDDSEYDHRHSATGELSSAQTQSSNSQESIYSTSNSSTRRSSRAIVIPEPPLATERDRQWQTLERYVLDAHGEVEARRQRFIWEFIESEDNFVAQLQNMIQLFILPLRVRDTRMWVSGIPSDVTNLFDWLDDIVQVHAQLSSALASRQTVDQARVQMISEVFRGFVPRLETYQPYLVKLEFAASVIDGLVHEGKNDFGDFIKLQEASKRCKGWSLEKYLIEPVNRLAQYPDIFRRLLQFTPKSHPDYMSTLSLFHATKLTIRVLSEVKDREDAYELVKVACSGIKVSNDEHASALLPLSDSQTTFRQDSSVSQDQHPRRADKLSKAINVWRGRSNSVKSTASTVVSFGTAPSSFDVHAGQQPVRATPVVRVESEPVDVQVLVFSDLVLLATRLDAGGDDASAQDASELEPVEGFGLSRVVSVLDEIDRRACVTLDLAPLDPRTLEEGYAPSAGPVVTVSLSLPRTKGCGSLAEWLPPLWKCCQYTRRALSSLDATHPLANRAGACSTAVQRPVLSLPAAGMPMPKSPSMQIEDMERGLAGDSEQQEREERGWWSKRFHEVFAELSAQDSVAC